MPNAPPTAKGRACGLKTCSHAPNGPVTEVGTWRSSSANKPKAFSVTGHMFELVNTIQPSGADENKGAET